MSRRFAIACCCLISSLLLSCVTATVGDTKVQVRAPALVAAALENRLIETERFFSDQRTRLRVVEEGPRPSPAYLEKEIVELVDETEKRLVDELEGRELAALADYFRAEFAAARRQLAPEPAAVAAPPVAAAATLRLAARTPGDAAAPGLRLARKRGKPLLEQSEVDPILDRILGELRRVIALAQDEDLVLDLCVESFPDDAKLWLYPLFRYPNHERTLQTNGWLPNVGRGAYVYRLTHDGYPEIRCLFDTARPSPSCGRLDLVNYDRPLIKCFLDPESAPGGAPSCLVEEKPQGWTCADSGP